jgi:hypothetical protein
MACFAVRQALEAEENILIIDGYKRTFAHNVIKLSNLLKYYITPSEFRFNNCKSFSIIISSLWDF